MANPKLRPAYRYNTLISTKPQTKYGQKQASINALKHGLTTPIELIPWASIVDNEEVFLEIEGFAFPERQTYLGDH